MKYFLIGSVVGLLIFFEGELFNSLGGAGNIIIIGLLMGLYYHIEERLDNIEDRIKTIG